MADLLGNITVPAPTISGTFPLVPDYPIVKRRGPVVVVHPFLSANAKIEQRFLIGAGRTVWTLLFREAFQTERDALADFYFARKGAYQPFTFPEPDPDGGGTTDRTVVFADEPLNYENLRDQVYSSGCTLIEFPTEFETFLVDDVLDRFPDGSLETALTGQEQTLVPLIDIYPKDAAYPVIRISNRKCFVALEGGTSGDLYHARLLSHQGISQQIGGSSDFVRFVMGNADGAMTLLAEDVDLFEATIQFSLLHVDTSTMVQIWRGLVWQANDTGPKEMLIECVDSAAELTLQCPRRRLTPLCGKLFDTAASGCPFSTASGELDLVHFPSASMTTCDHGYGTANGCLAHKMERYYGGLQLDPQTVRVKDNSTGWFGQGRLTQTATSLVGDTAMGQPLAIIVTDIPITVPCQLMAGRDEGDFYEALGIVGQGPITFGRGMSDSSGSRLFHKLDGQPNHGDPGPLGLREITGTDPAGATDWVSLDQSGDQRQGDFRKVYSGNSTYLNNYAAGVAAVVIRRTDEKGFQLTTLDQHKIDAVVYMGLFGPTWAAPGSSTPGNLVNPIWLCVALWLDAYSVINESAAVQEQYIHVESAIACAAICNLSVQKLIGEGMETQFLFRGMIRDIKPLKDWLSEILMCCLGGFVISNGRLKFFLRSDSAAEAQFSIGNMITDSLSLQSPQPSFNRITVNYANSDYGMVQDAIPVQDEDRIRYDRKVKDSYVNLPGAATKSMAGRIGTVLLREELGGITPTEHKHHRAGGFKTTALAIGLEVGMGLGITHPKVPGSGNYGVFRCLGWVLNEDYSLDVAVRRTTDSMYDLVSGPKAVDVPANPLPAEFFPFPLRSAWFPNEIAPQEDDAMFAQTDRTFTVAIVFSEDANPAQQAFVVCGGRLAINRFVPDTIPPVIASQSQATTGGLLPGGRNYFAQVFARDSDGHYSPGSNIRRFTFMGTATHENKIGVGDISWPAGTWSDACLFIGDDERLICFQMEVADSGGDLPASMEFTEAFAEATFNAPSPAHSFVRGKVKRAIHSGVIGTQITEVDTSGSTITLGSIAGGTDDWTGRLLYLAAKFDNRNNPPSTFLILDHDVATGVMELSPAPMVGQLDIDDLVYVRLVPNIYTGLTIGDTALVNDVYPGGLDADAEVGYLVRGITPGRPHQVRRIVSNTDDTYTVDRAFDFEPTTFIVEEAGWTHEAVSTVVGVPDGDIAVSVAIPVSNFLDQPIIAAVFQVDRQNGETPDELCILRELYCFGKVAPIQDLSLRPTEPVYA